MFNQEKPVSVIIDKEKCTQCGICAKICQCYLKMGEDGYPEAMMMEESGLGCIQCGNCMMLCPKNAIEIKGEDIDASHLRDLSQNPCDFESLNNLFVKRRSHRNFLEKEIPEGILKKIIDSAATAAVSVPPSEVKVLVIQGKDKVQELADDIIKAIKEFNRYINPVTMLLMRIFAGRAKYRLFKEFIFPLCNELVKERENGRDILFYNAPCAMVFYGSELIGAVDPVLAANQATLAAEALGIGTCFIGTLGAMFENNSKLREKYGILKGEVIGTSFILGYPKIKFLRGFQRNLKEVRFVKD